MNKLALLAVLASACATGGHTLVAERESAPHAAIQLDFAKGADTAAVFPRAIEPMVPSVDRIGREVRGTLGDTATAQVDLCVSAAGKVTKASLVRGSSFSEFDQALLRDIEDWRFSSLPGPASLQTCERATVTYHPY